MDSCNGSCDIDTLDTSDYANDLNNKDIHVNEFDTANSKHKDINVNINELDTSNSSREFIELQGLMSFYIANKSNLKIAHTNINSLRNKFEPLSEVLEKGLLDILIIQETKLDDTFLDGLFTVPGFKMYRKDVNSSTGGIIMYVWNDFLQFRYREVVIVHKIMRY